MGGPRKAHDPPFHLSHVLKTHMVHRFLFWQLFTLRFRVTTQIYNTLEDLSTAPAQHSYLSLANCKFIFKLSKTEGAPTLCARSTPTPNKKHRCSLAYCYTSEVKHSFPRTKIILLAESQI